MTFLFKTCFCFQLPLLVLGKGIQIVWKPFIPEVKVLPLFHLDSFGLQGFLFCRAFRIGCSRHCSGPSVWSRVCWWNCSSRRILGLLKRHPRDTRYKSIITDSFSNRVCGKRMVSLLNDILHFLLWKACIQSEVQRIQGIRFSSCTWWADWSSEPPRMLLACRIRPLTSHKMARLFSCSVSLSKFQDNTLSSGSAFSGFRGG